MFPTHRNAKKLVVSMYVTYQSASHVSLPSTRGKTRGLWGFALH